MSAYLASKISFKYIVYMVFFLFFWLQDLPGPNKFINQLKTSTINTPSITSFDTNMNNPAFQIVYILEAVVYRNITLANDNICLTRLR